MRLSIGLIVRLIVLVLLVAFVVSPQSFEWAFLPLTKNGQPAIYVQNSLLSLTLSHLAFVAIATIASTIVAVGLAIVVTRPFGAEFLPLSRSLANIGQTFHPSRCLRSVCQSLVSAPARRWWRCSSTACCRSSRTR